MVQGRGRLVLTRDTRRSQSRFRKAPPYLHCTGRRQLVVVRCPQRPQDSPEPALLMLNRSLFLLLRLPKPALLSRDPPAETRLLGNVVQTPPLQTAPFTVGLISGENRLRKRLLHYPLPQSDPTSLTPGPQSPSYRYT
ncbi:hypothetical protein STEG23_031807 [Scotinomys teguina]